MNITSFLWDNKYYFIFGIILLIIIILFVCIYLLQKSIHNIKIVKRTNVFAWKYSYMFMKNNHKKDNRLRRVIFYTKNVIVAILILTFGVYLYENSFVINKYLYYMQYAYIVGLTFEVILLVFSVNTTILKNFNNVNDENTCILIPFGGANLEDKLIYIEDTLKRASSIVDPCNVFLLHNGKDLSPKLYEKIKPMCDKIGINYVYVPQPNKSYAIYYASKNLCKNFEQCLIIDDDVPLRPNTYIPNMKAKIGAYLITAHTDDQMNVYEIFLSHLQGLEYSLSGMVKILQSRWNFSTSALSHHGAIGLWKRKELIEIMEKHDSLFHGEDLMMGILSYLSNYNLKVIEGVFIPTRTPTKIFGNGGLFKQRVTSWDFIIFKFIGTYIKILFHGGFFEHFMLKIFILYELWTLFIDLQRIPLLIYVAYREPVNLIIFTVSLYLMNVILIFWFNYVTLYDFDNKASLTCIFTFPLYKIMLIVFRILGEINYVIKYRSTIYRYPILIENMPALPDILEDTTLTLQNVDWSKIYASNEYIRNSVRIEKPINVEMISMINKEEEIYNRRKEIFERV